MHAPGIFQLILIIILVLLLFGSKRIPEFMENIAKGVKSFKKGMADEDSVKNKIEKKDD
ncbi:MAG: twin-arginine translocase TatA/TatE family subunit [Alphaproteobacteria bacterium]|nr:twin-arginine translocase TatA/TatE family subunit [Alphaproteobacteria bacterium]